MKKRLLAAVLISAMMLAQSAGATGILGALENTNPSGGSSLDVTEEQDLLIGVWELSYLEKEEEDEPTAVHDTNSWMIFTEDNEFKLVLSGESVMDGVWVPYEDEENAYILAPLDFEDMDDAFVGMVSPAGETADDPMFITSMTGYYLFFTKDVTKSVDDYMNRKWTES